MTVEEERATETDSRARLTDKQAAWLDAYLQCFNATEAARQAGYQATPAALRTIGYRNVRHPVIAEQIEAHFAASAMARDEVLARLAAQARADMGVMLKVDDAGDLVVDWPRIIENGHLVKALSWTQFGPKLELHDAQKALELIGKHLGLLSDRIDHEHHGAIDHRHDTITVYEYGDDAADRTT